MSGGHSAEKDARWDLTERLTGAAMVEQVADAIEQAQMWGKVEYKRRVGRQGRLSIATAALDRVCEQLGLPTSVDLLLDPAPGPRHNHDATGVYANCPACGTVIPPARTDAGEVSR